MSSELPVESSQRVGSNDGWRSCSAKETNDDELIAKLLQQEFDLEYWREQEQQRADERLAHLTNVEEQRLADQAGQARAQRPPVNPRLSLEEGSSKGPGTELKGLERASPRIQQGFSIADAKSAIQGTLNDVLGSIWRNFSSSPPAQAPSPEGILRAPVVNTESIAQKGTIDFDKFLDRLRDPRAAVLMRYLSSFLREFRRRDWKVNEQVKIAHDFISFMADRVAEHDLWESSTGEDLENAKECIEKLVMNKLHPFTFCPPTTDDAERDEILHKKMRMFRWIQIQHLDISIAVNPPRRNLLNIAKAELLNMNEYRAPRDKLICILNCCKVIYGFLKQAEKSSADQFLPALIYVVIKANPNRLISNVQYISRFRNPQKLQSEAGYYLTNLMGAISFIETMDSKSLTLTQEEFDGFMDENLRDLEVEAATLEKSQPRERDVAVFGRASVPRASEFSGPEVRTENPLRRSSSALGKEISSFASRVQNAVSRWFGDEQESLATEPERPVSLDSIQTRANAGAGAQERADSAWIQAASMSPEQRVVLEDYDLQLALALSLSLQQEARTETGGWESISGEPLSPDDHASRVESAGEVDGAWSRFLEEKVKRVSFSGEDAGPSVCRNKGKQTEVIRPEGS